MDGRAGVRTAEKSPGHSEPAMAFSSSFSAGAPVRLLPTPAGRMPQQLAGLDDRELLAIVQSEPLASARRDAACELLVSRHRRLVWSCVQPYRCSPEPAEDLVQVGYVGLVKAINNFDPEAGGSLAAYAQPCISGEIKRHFRDKPWQVRGERPGQELVLEGRRPGEAELAEHLGRSREDVALARRAELVFSPSSLDAPLAGRPDAGCLADVLGAEDPAMEHALDMAAVAAHWGGLPRRGQRVLLLRV